MTTKRRCTCYDDGVGSVLDPHCPEHGSKGPPRIYLAGPDVFLDNATEHAKKLKSICSSFGFEGVFPLDVSFKCVPCEGEGSIHVPTAQPEYQACSNCNGTGSLATAEKIFKANVELIRSCQGVLANMQPFRGPSMDVGTGWEMGFAYALGLPIVGYSPDQREYFDRVRQYRTYTKGVSPPDPFFDPTMVEDFKLHDNLMLDCSTTIITNTFERAAEHMSVLLKART